MLLRLAPIILAILYGLLMWKFSTWRLRKEMDARSELLEDPALHPTLDRLAQALDLPKIDLHLYKIDPVNGLAAPDGRIYVTRGLYDRVKSGFFTYDELASVVAHELGHVALGHARRRLIDFSGQNALRTVLMIALGRLLPFGIGAWVANMATSLLAARLSRRDEFEADSYASALLIKSGIGTQGQKTLFQKLDQMSTGMGRPPAWLQSHPSSAERIKAIESHERAWGLGQKV